MDDFVSMSAVGMGSDGSLTVEGNYDNGTQCCILYHVSMHSISLDSPFYLPQTLPAPMVDITPTGDSVAGSMYTLTCTVTVVENLVAQPTVEWLDSEQHTVMSGSDITVDSVIRQNCW